ncbi:aldo/keto reductase [Glutamicibacter sp. MNS18]|uniref:aldo/keto reductase n=1 Tax=Glutamicibacter sp. MNS18 TaxID=2989817 RepID=UPI0022361514|nr:aldo/keto reductase [Glutamicibacter sp. MNS18]MCW4464959.1 aldo/keto reductase [Glutamicibacter sp. MNS18]
MDALPQLHLGDGAPVLPVGQGTWFLGDDPARRDEEIATLRTGVELGLALVDTAEMYGAGRSEELVGEAIAPIRDQVYLVSKVLPSNASEQGTVKACEESLGRLGTDWIDLYLLHWPGPYPLEDTIRGFESLKSRGLIGDWGVSNFDTEDLRMLPVPPAANQVLYNPASRGIEYDLLPAQREAQQPIPVMAYSPIGQGELLDHPVLRDIARQLGASVAQLLIAWSIRNPGVIALPKASQVSHVRDNARALELQLGPEHTERIDAAFPAPQTKIPLEVI